MKVCHRDGRGRYGCIFTSSGQNDGDVSKDQLTIGPGINEDTDAPFYLRPKEKSAARGQCCRSPRTHYARCSTFFHQVAVLYITTTTPCTAIG